MQRKRGGRNEAALALRLYVNVSEAEGAKKTLRPRKSGGKWEWKSGKVEKWENNLCDITSRAYTPYACQNK